MSQYPWTPVLVLILLLLVVAIVRAARRPKAIDRSLAVHQEFHTGPHGRRYPEFCEHCRDESGG
jgi:hypothetical protein